MLHLALAFILRAGRIFAPPFCNVAFEHSCPVRLFVWGEVGEFLVHLSDRGRVGDRLWLDHARTLKRFAAGYPERLCYPSQEIGAGLGDTAHHLGEHGWGYAASPGGLAL